MSDEYPMAQYLFASDPSDGQLEDRTTETTKDTSRRAGSDELVGDHAHSSALKRGAISPGP
jgi:hypothetical protein